MRAELPVCQIARVTLETTSPLSIAIGRGDGLRDTLVVKDAHGLPILPGTAIAGVLRHSLEKQMDSSIVDDLFGFAESNESRPSRLEISWGRIHTAVNVPLDGLHTDFLDDPILSPLLNDVLPMRDGIRINEYGVAEDRGKFDRSYVPIGHRFTFDLALWSQGTSNEMDSILRLLQDPLFRLGGATRRGFGAFKVHEVRLGGFDLRKAEDLQKYTLVSANLSNNTGLDVIETKAATNLGSHSVEVSLTPEVGGFHFGAGDDSLGGSKDKTADKLPLSEKIVEWEQGRGHIVQRKLLIPASSVKGALAHRVAFHFNRFNLSQSEAGDKNPAVRELFGYMKENDEGKAGSVWIDDILVPIDRINIATHQHNSIDRFTGGARKGVLFSEEVVHQHSFTLRIHIDRTARFEAKTLRAFQLALKDLIEGRLALGASASKGYGYFNGQMIWPADLVIGELQ